MPSPLAGLLTWSLAALHAGCAAPSSAEGDAAFAAPDADATSADVGDASIGGARIAFVHAVVVSAYPAVKAGDGAWVRVCAADARLATGIITNVVLASTQRRPDGAGPRDDDLSIRPGDVVEARTVGGDLPVDIDLETAGHLGLELDCIDPQPQPNPSAGGCQGAVPSAQLDGVDYVAHTPSRAEAHDVILLIDQSGSIGGIVAPDEGYREDEDGRFDLPNNFGDLASDRFSLRLAAARAFTDSLNEADRLGVIAFGERLANGAGLKVPCADAAGLDVQAGLAACFGPDREPWHATSGIDSLRGDALGRSNLWRAVQAAYDFLAARPASAASNHIVVLTDGPDTCVDGESLTRCASRCSTVTHDHVLERIQADQVDPDARRIQIHFVQFESLGYDGRDPRQVEAACLSGGHYQYINSNDYPRDQLAALQESLDQALRNVRFALMGHWALAAAVPAYAQGAPAPAGSPPGALYGLSGALVVRASSHLVSADREFPFGVGQGAGATSAPAWDRRPTVLKPCGSASDCGGTDGPACSVVCSRETHVCPAGAVGITLPDTAACDAGSCCDGQCVTTGSACQACVDRP
ncbi:MAG: VWA domain-containing protein [Deltaproteobacteria bacterium]|nr:VWA domain-containing protein [Deltaproteobacteria bacterium]